MKFPFFFYRNTGSLNKVQYYFSSGNIGRRWSNDLNSFEKISHIEKVYTDRNLSLASSLLARTWFDKNAMQDVAEVSNIEYIIAWHLASVDRCLNLRGTQALLRLYWSRGKPHSAPPFIYALNFFINYA